MSDNCVFDCERYSSELRECEIVAHEISYSHTKVIPNVYTNSKDDIPPNAKVFDIEYGDCDFVDSEIDGFSCQTCGNYFTYSQLIDMIKEEEE